MSYTKIILFKQGKMDRSIEFENSWGGAFRIWQSLFNTYVPKKSEHDSPLQDSQRVWDLVKRTDIPKSDRAVLAFTFDLFYVRQNNFEQFELDLVAFVKRFPVETGFQDHLPAWIKCFKEHAQVEAIGLYATSVGENLWRRYKICEHCGNQTDEEDLVPLSEGSEVYERLAKIESKD